MSDLRKDIMSLMEDRQLSREELENALRISNNFSHSGQLLNHRSTLIFLRLIDELDRVEERLHAMLGTALKEIADASIEYSSLEHLVEILNEQSAMHKDQASRLSSERTSK